MVPTRNRRAGAARLLDSYLLTRQADTDLVFLADDDDRDYGLELPAGVWTERRPRLPVSAKLNLAADEHAGRYKNLMYIGDDHVAVTPGWDRILLKALETPGFAYCDNQRRDDVPESVAISSMIVKALGWFALPTVQHYWMDNAWGKLGRATGCLRYRPAAVMPHLHYADGNAPEDEIYRYARQFKEQDWKAYQEWLVMQMPIEVRLLKGIL